MSIIKFILLNYGSHYDGNNYLPGYNDFNLFTGSFQTEDQHFERYTVSSYYISRLMLLS